MRQFFAGLLPQILICLHQKQSASIRYLSLLPSKYQQIRMFSWDLLRRPILNACILSKLMRIEFSNRGLSIVDCRLATDECQLPLIVPFLCIVRRRCIVTSSTITTITNRPCMHLHLITIINRKMMKIDKYRYKMDQFSSFYD